MSAAELPSSLLGWSGVFAMSAAGVFALASIFDRQWRSHRQTRDEAADGAIKLLKEEVAQLQNALTTANEKIRDMEIEQTRLAERNKTLAEVLQGRDADTVRFRELALKSFEATARGEAAVASMLADFREHMKRVETALGAGAAATASALAGCK
jgi:predicted component of type VI protein secretion system